MTKRLYGCLDQRLDGMEVVTVRRMTEKEYHRMGYLGWFVRTWLSPKGTYVMGKRIRSER